MDYPNESDHRILLYQKQLFVQIRAHKVKIQKVPRVLHVAEIRRVLFRLLLNWAASSVMVTGKHRFLFCEIIKIRRGLVHHNASIFVWGVLPRTLRLIKLVVPECTRSALLNRS